MIAVSLCMIVRNEERMLGRCLDSVRDVADEIIIVDTGSTDRTKEIAAQYTNRIYDFEWTDDFAAARNAAFDQATLPYQMWLDADDIVLPPDRNKLLELKATLAPDIDAVLMDYVLERDALGSAQNYTRRHRLFKRDKRYRWVGSIHEYVPVPAGDNVLRANIEITHAPIEENKDRGRNLRILQKVMQQEQFANNPRFQFYLASELLGNERPDEAEKLFKQVLAGPTLFAEEQIAACGALSHMYHIAPEPKPDQELHYLLQTFRYDKPRADYCARIGNWFQEQGRFDLAVFWYELALQLGEPDSLHGLMNKAGWTWGPHVQLTICYGKLGKLDLARKHNEAALAYFPNDPTLLANRKKLDAAIGSSGAAQPNARVRSNMKERRKQDC